MSGPGARATLPPTPGGKSQPGAPWRAVAAIFTRGEPRAASYPEPLPFFEPEPNRHPATKGPRDVFRKN